MMNEELFDMDKMEYELADEIDVGYEILAAGHAQLLPLQNSIALEETGQFTGAEFIAADLVMIRALNPAHAFMVMRRGWRNGSEGAALERETALQCGWDILDMDEMDMGEFRVHLQFMRKANGACVVYVSGKYRHYKNLSYSPCPGAGDGV